MPSTASFFDGLFYDMQGGPNPDHSGYAAWRAQIDALLEEHCLKAVTFSGPGSFNSYTDVHNLLRAGCDPGRIAAAKLLAFGG
jgi:hypothetical protein